MFDKLNRIRNRLEEILQELSAPEVQGDAARVTSLMKEQAELQPVAEVFEVLRDLRITPSLHRVPLKETANECWHILFGNINEALVRNGLVSVPEAHAGEGRYLRCVVLG